MQVEKTIFISYRRSTSTYQARAVYQSLTALGYDVFLDFETIDSGAFDQVILNQIKARAHFIVILSPGTLERCADPNDWLRREIETAMAYERNIVPLLFSGFSFGDSKKHLTGKLADLSRYNAIKVYADYFDEAISRLHTRFLSKPLDAVLHPVSALEQTIVEEQQAEVKAQPTVTERELVLSEVLDRAYVKGMSGNLDAAITDYLAVLDAKPDHAYAAHNLGVLYTKKGQYEDALPYFEQAIRLSPKDSAHHTEKGLSLAQAGDIEGAIAAFSAALTINPNSTRALYNRILGYRHTEQYEAALFDLERLAEIDKADDRLPKIQGLILSQLERYDEALASYRAGLQTDPDNPSVLNNIGWVYYLKGDYEQAVRFASRAIRGKSYDKLYAAAYHTRGVAYLALNDCQRALADLEMALSLQPDRDVYKEELAKAREQCQNSS